MNRWIDRWSFGAIGLIGLLIGAAGLTFHNTRQLNDDSAWVAHTHDVMTGLEKILSQVKDGENGQRGYLITGDPIYLKPYDEAVAAISAQMDHVERLTADNPGQQARFPELRRLIGERLATLDETIRLRQSGDAEGARAILLGGRGRDQMDAIRGLVGVMIGHEQDLLRERSKAREQTYATALIAGLLSGIAAVIGVIAFAGLLRRHLAAQVAASRQIAEHGERLRTTLASIGDAVIATDTEGRITNMNAVAESLTGWTIDAALGKPLDTVFRIVNEATREPVANPASRALREGVIVGLANHTVLIARDGVERPIDDSAAPIRCQAGEIVGCVLIFRDVTERRQTELRTVAARAQAENIVDSIREPLLVFDSDLRVILASRSFCQIFKRTRAETEGRLLSELSGRRWDTAPLRTLLERVLTENVQFDDYEVERDVPGLGHRVMLMNARRVHGEGPDGDLVLLVIEDITERKRHQENESRLAAVVESSLDAIITKSLDGIVRSWNAAAERMFGYSAEEAVGRRISFLFPSDRLTEEDGIIARLQAGMSVEPFDTVRLRKDGRLVHVSLTISPIKDAEGRVVGASKIARDITEKKRLEELDRENLRRLRFVLNSMPQKIFTSGPSGAVDYTNPQWAEFTGLPFEQLDELGWFDLIHEDERSETRRIWERCVENGASFNFEHRFRRVDGEYRWHVSRVVPMRDAEGRVVMWIGSNTEIHEQKEAANRLRELAADLSEADRRKNEFLAMLAHELRNPLAPIRNAVEILRSTSAREREAVLPATQILERQVGQLVRLVDDLLDVTRISRGKVELRRERVDLGSIVNQTVEANMSLVDSMQQDLRVTLPAETIHLDADATRLAQILGNLINNACKFTDGGGSISVEVERQGDHAAIHVRDTGIGIAADQLHRIFDMFAQVDSSLQRSPSGLGLGLTLVKNLVEMHGGSVDAFSSGPGQGSDFVVRLPIADDVDPRREVPAVIAPPAFRRRILIVDDNRDAAESLAALLALRGHEVHTAYDGLEAVAVAETLRPDVVVMDIGLPKLNGYEACRRIRERPWGAQLLLVALTGWGQEEDRRKSREAGFDGHLIKPVDPAALARLLEPVDTCTLR